ncbi:MAG TPA: hypothetical protein VKY89_14300 [Thermoanaerobaculia bacterium]|jgi:hypothetical protein|nr:hypothetical protein [Thermoanaerobaculia bacterium]
MKKKVQKMDLHRETLRILGNQRDLEKIVGAYTNAGPTCPRPLSCVKTCG